MMWNYCGTDYFNQNTEETQNGRDLYWAHHHLEGGDDRCRLVKHQRKNNVIFSKIEGNVPSAAHGDVD